MRKTIFALAIAVVSVAVQAQNTAEAMKFRSDMCAVVGSRARNAYHYKEAGRPYPISHITDSPVYALELWAVKYATNDASSDNEAASTAIAKCIDNVDRVFRDDRHGHRTTLDEIQ